jgi:16S rRNA (adenine1518-N6/adenine1519-N6)-dimethyltransferase
MSHRPKKRLGQNFLSDQSIIDRMIRMFHIKPTDNVIEIGPGQGALTRKLKTLGKHFACIEYDIDLVNYLKEHHPGLSIYHQDALDFNFSEYAQDKPLRVIGNLPYNISTPILFHLLDQVESINDMHFLLQKEVVQRMCAPPNSKTYGRLSIMVQYICQCEHLFDVANTAFYPAPKVQSAVIHLRPYTVENCPYEKVDLKLLNKVVTTAFCARRKTLSNALKPLFDPEVLQGMDLNLKLRPENLSIADFVMLAKCLSAQQSD